MSICFEKKIRWIVLLMKISSDESDEEVSHKEVSDKAKIRLFLSS